MDKAEKVCNFCGLTLPQVEFMVNGPGELYICNVCIEACMKKWQDFKSQGAYLNSQKIADTIT